MFSFILSSSMIFTSFTGVKPVRTVDGDTVIVRIPDMPEVFTDMRIRLKGVDAPEMKADRACERRDAVLASVTVDSLIRDRPLNLSFCEPDLYFRLACFGAIDKIDLSGYLLEHGLAMPYSGGTKLKWKCRK